MRDYDSAVLAAALARHSRRPVLPKRVLSSQTRLVFVAGLEGSGHHLWSQLLTDCCTPARALAHELWSWRDKAGLWLQEAGLMRRAAEAAGPGWAVPSHAVLADWDRERAADERSVREALQAIKAAQPGARFLNQVGAGQLSYPNFAGKWKIFQHPDVRSLAELAETEGVDFRVLVLHRDPASLLRSTTRHRHFLQGSWNAEALVLEYNARVLTAQVRALAPGFVLCSEYAALPRGPEGLDEFVLADLQRRLRQQFTPKQSIPHLYFSNFSACTPVF